MQIDQVIIFVLTYLFTHLLNRWPDFRNDALPRIAFVFSIVGQVIANLMGTGTVHTVAPAYAAAFCSFGAPVQAALPAATGLATLVQGSLLWVTTQGAHLLFEKLIPGFLKKVLGQKAG